MENHSNKRETWNMLLYSTSEALMQITRASCLREDGKRRDRFPQVVMGVGISSARTPSKHSSCFQVYLPTSQTQPPCLSARSLPSREAVGKHSFGTISDSRRRTRGTRSQEQEQDKVGCAENTPCGFLANTVSFVGRQHGCFST